MNKYPLSGVSICAVVLLVLGSLSNVVGYQSVKSTSTTESPLFSIRTQKAINKDSNVLTSNYLGKGFSEISFPLKDNRTALIQKVLDKIRTMDDKEFNRFQSLILSWFYEKQHIKNTDNVHLFNLIKQGSIPKEFDTANYDIIKNRTKPPTYIEYTCKGVVCFIDFLFILVYILLADLFYLITHLFTLNQCQYGYFQ